MILCSLALLWTRGLAPVEAAEGGKPVNVILVLADDMGWTGLGCMGSRFYETPHLDRLAREGMRFTQAYAACTVCSPTRAAILTGKYPGRLRLTNWIMGHKRPKAKLRDPDWTKQLPLEEITLAEALKAAGYVSASIGKWHLGGEDYSPERQGFDRNVAGYDRGSTPSYFSPYGIPTLADGPEGEYLTDREAAEAVRFIEDNRDRPFFLYLAHYAVHTPLEGRKELAKRYREKPPEEDGQGNPVYAAMTESVDQSMGAILARLNELNLADQTVIIFTSDNGGLIGRGRRTITSNRPLRAGKGSPYEGGVRVPLLVKWPGVIAAGSVCDVPVMSVDFFPSILEMTGTTAHPGLDGVSLVPLFKRSGGLNREALYWHFPHYHPGGATPYGAIRRGDWKLIEFFEDDAVELYDLGKDPGETEDLANQLPEDVARLRWELRRWRDEVGAQMPLANLSHDPAVRPPRRPSRLVAQGDDGVISLHARDVVIHGKKLRYEPQPHKNTIGYWTAKDDWASWDFEVKRPGRFRVGALQGCGPKSGGSEVVFSVANQDLTMKVQETRHFQDFIPRELGEVVLNRRGRYTLTVRPKSKPGLAVMDLRSVTLRPL